jgi:hypothetical protein
MPQDRGRARANRYLATSVVSVADRLDEDDAPAATSSETRLAIVPPVEPSYRWNIAWALRAYLISRAVVFGCAVVSVLTINANPAKGPWSRYGAPHVPVLQALGRWDGAWYIEVARNGYATIHFGHTRYASRAFFPGYPLVVRILSTITPAPALLSALIVTTVLGGVVALLVWRLVADISGEAAARRAVVLFSFAPGAFVLSMAYSEALFLVGAVACVMLLMRRRWVWAGMFAALASFTRPNGVAVVATCGIVALVAIARERDWRALAAPVIGAFGTVVYFAFLLVNAGDAFAWFKAERRGWGDRIAPIDAAVHHLSGLANTSLNPGGLNDLSWLLFFLVGVAGAVLLVRWGPPLPVLAYGLVSGGFAMTSYQVGLRPRMLLISFPLILAAGVQLRGRPYRALLAVSFVLLCALSLLSFGTLVATP